MLSPVGALTNGLELLADEKDPAMRQRCFELLEQSARISADKLKFFRLAFGAAGGFGEMVPVNEARVLVDALVANNARIAVTWTLPSDVLPKPAVKTLLNFALIGIDALPRGGTLRIAHEGAALTLTATGAIAADPALWEGLSGSNPLPAADPRRIEFALLARHLTKRGARIAIRHDPEKLRLSLSQSKTD